MLRLPNITGGTPQERINQITSYLYQLVNELEHSMSQTEQSIQVVRSELPSSSQERTSDDILKEFSEIKSLIIKSADIIDSYAEKIIGIIDLSGKFVAQSDFGKYVEVTNARIDASNEEISSTVEKLALVESDVEFVKQETSEIKQTSAEISLSLKDTIIKLDSLDVGGTNLLLDTDAPSLTKVAADYDRYMTSPVDGENAAAEFAQIENSPCGTQNLFRVKIITAQPNSGTTVAGLRFYNHTGPMPLGISFIPGEQYTMSCYARTTSGAPKINMTMWGLTAWGWQDVPEEWTKFSLTFKATEDFNSKTSAWAVFSAHKSYVGTLEMTGFKIERGNKATDWTPATEDTQSQIDGVVSDVSDKGLIIASQESRISGLELTNQSITASVEKVKKETETTLGGVTKNIEELQQKASLAITEKGVDIAIKNKLQNADGIFITGTDYGFSADGLKVAKDGEEMNSMLNNEGFKVKRSLVDILTANYNGVDALNLSARQYLIVGENARFEDYETGRTACFWIGG